MTKSIMNLLKERRVFGFTIKMLLLTLLVLSICTCSGVKLMSVNQTFASQTDYSIYSGRLVRPMPAVMDCATLRIDDLDSHLWHQARWLTWQPYPLTLDMEYYLRVDQMRRRCLQTRWYQYRLITPSFSSRYRTVWTDQRQSSRIAYPRQSTPVRSSRQTNRLESSTVLTPRSTGRTPVTTRTTVRNSNYSSTTRAVNGKSRRTSSTTGGLRKPVYD